MILIIEDDNDIRDAYVELLQQAGYQTALAGNGLEAIALLEKGLKPKLILCDLTMPEMDGAEFRAHQLARPEWATIPTVILTAGKPDRVAIAKLQAQEFLVKPVDFDVFMNTVRRYY